MELINLYYYLNNVIDNDYMSIIFIVTYILLLFNTFRLNFTNNSIKYSLLTLLIILTISNIIIFYLQKTTRDDELKKKIL